jgi:hypothetical protein
VPPGVYIVESSWELQTRVTPFSVYRCQHTKCPNGHDQVSGVYYIEYMLTLEDHPALALQEGTGHLGDFAALD